MKTLIEYRTIKVNKQVYGVRYIAISPEFVGITGGGRTKRIAKSILKEGISMYLETLNNHQPVKIKLIPTKW